MADRNKSAESGASTASSSGVVHPGASPSETTLWAPAQLSAGDEGSTSTFRLPELASSSAHEGLFFPENNLLSLWLANHASQLHADALEPPLPAFIDQADPSEDASFEDLGVYMQQKFPKLWADANIPPCPPSPPSLSLPRWQAVQGSDQSPSSPLALHYASDESPTNSPWPATTNSSLPLPVQSGRMIPPRSKEAVAPTAPLRRELFSAAAANSPPAASATTHHQVRGDGTPRMLSSDIHAANASSHLGDLATHNQIIPAHRTQMASVAPQGMPAESGRQIQALLPDQTVPPPTFENYNISRPVASRDPGDDLNRVPASSHVHAANAVSHAGAGFAAVPIYAHTPAPTNSVGANIISPVAASPRRIHGSDPWNALNLPQGFTSVYGLKPLPPNHTETPIHLVPNASVLAMPTIGRVPGYAVAGPSFTAQRFSPPHAPGAIRSWLEITNPSSGHEIMTPAGRSSPHVVVRPLPHSALPAPNAGSMPFRYPRIDRRPLQAPADAAIERPSKRPNLAVESWTAMGNHRDGNRYVRVSDPRPTLLYRPQLATSSTSSLAGWWRGGVGIKYYNSSLPPFATPTTAPPAYNIPMEVIAVGPALNTNGKPRVRRGAATDPQSVYARFRRTKISSRMQELQQLIPNGTKVDLVTMLEEAFNYVKFLEHQIQLLKSDENWMLATPNTYKGIRHQL